MFNQSLFHNATLPIANLGYEQVYPVSIPNTNAFELINTAVWYTLARLAPGYNTIWNGVPGGMCYYIGSNGIHIQLFVLRLTANAAKVRVFPLYPIDPIEGILWMHANHQRVVEVLAAVFTACRIEIDTFLRDAARAENYNPPPPATRNWEEKLDWQDRYYPDWSDEKIELHFGKEYGITAKSLANNRSHLRRKKKKRAGRSG